MRHRFILAAALCAGFLVSAAAPALADWHGHGGWHGGGWHGGGWHGGWHPGWHPGWGWRGWGPRVVIGGPAYYPPPYYAYPYPYYAPGINVTIPIR